MTALDYALGYARRGWYVFPLAAGQKVPPAGVSWPKVSTNDPAAVEALADLYPGCNWGLDCGKSGLVVLDIDKKDGVDGFKTLLGLGKGRPTGYMVSTPRGGIHVYYKGVAPSTAGKLGPGLDTRGTGGYVVIPGSVNGDGRPYKLTPDGPLQPLPPWLPEFLGKAAEKKPDRHLPAAELDTDAHIKAAIDYLENRAPQAVEGQGGDQTTYQVACRVRDLGVSADTAVALMLEHWNEHKAFPSWEPDELERKVRNAYRYAKDRAGNATPEALFPGPDFGGDPSAGAPETPEAPRSSGRILCVADFDEAKIPPRRWLLGHRYLPGYMTVTIAPGGVGKSLVTILEGLSLVSGYKLTHDEPKICGPVWIYNAEDPIDELQRRFVAAAKFHSVPKSALKDLFTTSGHSGPFRLVEIVDRRPHINPKVVDALIREIKARGVKLFVADPFVRLHGVDENDNTAIDLVAQALTRIAAETDCAVSVVHHSRKLQNAKEGRGNADIARGASSLISAARIAHTVASMLPKEAAKYGLAPERACWFLRLDSAKANLSAPGELEGRWYERHGVHVGNDPETTGVLARADISLVEEMTESAELVQAVVSVVGGGKKSVNAVADELLDRGLVEACPKTTLRRKIEEAFRAPARRTGCEYVLGEVPGGRGGAVPGILCEFTEEETD